MFLQVVDAVLIWESFPEDDAPVCADGSPAGVFVEDVHAANPVDPTRHVIVVTGGGACTSPQDCQDAYKMEPFKFSSNQLPKQIDGHTIISSNPKLNPQFHSFTKWLLPYCTQDFFLGSITSTTDTSRYNTNDTTTQTFLHDGSRVLQRSLQLWKQKAVPTYQYTYPSNVNTTTSTNTGIQQVVMVGLSAGAVGIMNQLDMIKEILASANVQDVQFILDAPTVLSDHPYTDKDFNDMMVRYVNLTQHPFCNPNAIVNKLLYQRHDLSSLPCCLSTHCMFRHNPTLQQYYLLQHVPDTTAPPPPNMDDNTTTTNTILSEPEEPTSSASASATNNANRFHHLFQSDTMLILDSAYDTFALAAGTVDDGSDDDDSEDDEHEEDHETVDDAWLMVESAGRRKARVLETALMAQWQQLHMIMSTQERTDSTDSTDDLSDNLWLLQEIPDVDVDVDAGPSSSPVLVNSTLSSTIRKSSSSRVTWIFSSCVTHTFLLPALEFLELSCLYGDYQDEDFDIVCNDTGFATRFHVESVEMHVETWRTIDTWDLVKFRGRSIHDIIDQFVLASAGTDRAADSPATTTTTTTTTINYPQSQQQLHEALNVSLAPCHGPNCMPLGTTPATETPSCQSMVQVDTLFRAVPLPFTVAWATLLLGFVLWAILTRIQSGKEQPQQGNQQAILDGYRANHPKNSDSNNSQGGAAFGTNSTRSLNGAGAGASTRSLYGSLNNKNESFMRRNNGKDFTLQDICVKTDKGAVLLEIDKLSLAYGTVNGICGRSGAGKSTLLKALSLLKRSGVSVTMTKGSGALRNMRRAFLRQDDAVAFGQLTPSEYLYWSASIYGTDPNMFENLYMFAEGLFHRGGGKKDSSSNNNNLDRSTGEQYKVIHPFYDTKIEQLSGGQARILSISTTLLLDPNILLLDEPLSGLDSVSSLQVMTSLQYIVERCGCIALLTVHQPSDAILEFFDRLLVVSAGKLALNSRISDAGVQAVSSKLNSHLCDSHRRTSTYMSQAFTQPIRDHSSKSEFVEAMAFTNALDNSVHLFNTTHHRRPTMSAAMLHMTLIEESGDEDSSEDDAKSFQDTSSSRGENATLGGTPTTDETQATSEQQLDIDEEYDEPREAAMTRTTGKKVAEEGKNSAVRSDNNKQQDVLDGEEADTEPTSASMLERLVVCVAAQCCCCHGVSSQIRPLVQRIQRQYGWGWKDIVPANVAIMIVALLLTTQEAFTFRVVALTVALVGIPVIVFPHKVFQYAETWKFHKRELDDLRISMVAFQISTSMFTFSMPVLSLTMAQAIGYAIVGLDFSSFLNQLLFSVVHLLVALQFGRSLAVLFRGDNPSIVQVFTFYLFLSFLLSSTLVASYKFPSQIRWIHWFSIDFWAISGAVMNQLDKDVSYSNAEDCFDFVTCLASDGGLIVSILGFSPMSTSYLALGVLSIWFLAFVALEHAMLHYRCEGR